MGTSRFILFKRVLLDELCQNYRTDCNRDCKASYTVHQTRQGSIFRFYDKFPHEREEANSLLIDHIRFCQEYEIPYLENSTQEYSQGPTKYDREEIVTKTVKYTIKGGEDAIKVLHKICFDLLLNTFDELKSRSNGWYERICNSDALDLIIKKMSAVLIPSLRKYYREFYGEPNLSSILILFYCHYDRVSFSTISLIPSLCISFKELGYEDLSSDQQINGMNAALLLRLFDIFKKEEFCFDVKTEGDCAYHGEGRMSFLIIGRNEKYEQTVLKRW